MRTEGQWRAWFEVRKARGKRSLVGKQLHVQMLEHKRPVILCLVCLCRLSSERHRLSRHPQDAAIYRGWRIGADEILRLPRMSFGAS